MFSTSIRASSITTPSPRTRPPRVMVFRLRPRARKATTAASRDRGMAAKEIRAARQSRSATISRISASPAPMRRSSSTSFTAAVITPAGRPAPWTTVTPWALSAGSSSANARSTARVASTVFAPY